MSAVLHRALLEYATALPVLDARPFADPGRFFAYLGQLPLSTLLTYLCSVRPGSADPVYDRLLPLRHSAPSSPVKLTPLPRAIFI